MPSRLNSGSTIACCCHQHDRQLGGQGACDDALIGYGFRRDVAEHRRHHAVGQRAVGDARDHGVEALLRRRYQRQAVA